MARATWHAASRHALTDTLSDRIHRLALNGLAHFERHRLLAPRVDLFPGLQVRRVRRTHRITGWRNRGGRL